jgi:hypothetical protein
MSDYMLISADPQVRRSSLNFKACNSFDVESAINGAVGLREVYKNKILRRAQTPKHLKSGRIVCLLSP